MVHPDSSKMVDVPGFGKTNYWMDQDISLAGTCCSHCQFSMGAMHGISGLESNNASPAELLEMRSKLCGSISKGNIVVMLEPVDSIQLATDIPVIGRVVKIFDSGMLRVTSENFLSLFGPTIDQSCVITSDAKPTYQVCIYLQR